MIDGGVLDFGALVATVTALVMVGNALYSRWFGVDRRIRAVYRLVVASLIVNMNRDQGYKKDLENWQPEAYALLQEAIKYESKNGRNSK